VNEHVGKMQHLDFLLWFLLILHAAEREVEVWFPKARDNSLLSKYLFILLDY
jgi:hypothetical protein